MSLGVRYELGSIAVNDTAELYASLMSEGKPIPANEIEAVEFTIQKPDEEKAGPFPGQVEEDGRGYYRWTHTTETGEYQASAQFTRVTGEKKSVLLDFAVVDPFDTTPITLEEIVADDVWLRLEDSFDSTEGGAWLKDVTQAHFDKKKIAHYIPETVLDINVQSPYSEAALADFAQPGPNGEPNALLPLVAKGVLCKVIMHLIRNYVEQPIPKGAPIAYEGREHYARAWKEVYDNEHTDYYTLVRLWKRGLLHLGHSALLVHSKAGRLYYGTALRTRNISRGFY
jgi:hypothetical protein